MRCLRDSGAFDLCVIDEAHEIFAGIYRRYDRHGALRARSRYASMAARVKAMLGGTPVLLLTATPIQNSLTELWGLVQYVEPTGTLLGDLPTFRTLFCDGDDRRLRPGQEEELRRRHRGGLSADPAASSSGVHGAAVRVPAGAAVRLRACRPREKALYDDVTAYLMEPSLCAFRGSHRRLLLIGFHRRMASSMAALAASLRKVAERLERMLRGKFDERDVEKIVDDLDDEDLGDVTDEVITSDIPPLSPERIRAELDRVRFHRSRQLASTTAKLPS